ncbi:hypothetical protein HK405_013459, partial [Cladochytrium tenue]
MTVLDKATVLRITTRLAALRSGNADRPPPPGVPRSAWRYRTHPPPRAASVLLPLCHVDGQAAVLFTVRTHTLRNHPGE